MLTTDEKAELAALRKENRVLSDQGSTYTSEDYQQLLHDNGIVAA